MKYTLKARIPAAECIRRLRTRTVRPPVLGLRNPPEETFYCRISGQRFPLYVLQPNSIRKRKTLK